MLPGWLSNAVLVPHAAIGVAREGVLCKLLPHTGPVSGVQLEQVSRRGITPEGWQDAVDSW